MSSRTIDGSSLESGLHRYAGDVNLMSIRIVFTDERSLAQRPTIDCQPRQAPSSTFLLSKKSGDDRWFIEPEEDHLRLKELGLRVHLIREPWSCCRSGGGKAGSMEKGAMPSLATAAIATDTMTRIDAGELKKREDEDLEVSSGRPQDEATRSREMMMMIMSTNGTGEDLAGIASVDVRRRNRVLSGESSKRQRAHNWKYNATVTSAVDDNNGISCVNTLARKLPHEMRNHQLLSLHSNHNNSYQADRAARRHGAHGSGDGIAENVDVQRNLDKQNLFCRIDVDNGELKIEENDCELRDWYRNWLLNGKRDLDLVVASESDRARRCQSGAVQTGNGRKLLEAHRGSSLTDDGPRDGILSASSTASTVLASQLHSDGGEQQISERSIRSSSLSATAAMCVNNVENRDDTYPAPQQQASSLPPSATAAAGASGGEVLDANINRLEMICDQESWVHPKQHGLIPAAVNEQPKATGLSPCSAGERLFIVMERQTSAGESFIPKFGPLGAFIISPPNVGATTTATRDASGTKVQELPANNNAKLIDGAITRESKSDLSLPARTISGVEDNGTKNDKSPLGANSDTSRQDSGLHRTPSGATKVDQESIEVVEENLIIDTDRQEKEEGNSLLQQQQQLRRQQPALTTDCWPNSQQQALSSNSSRSGKVVCLAVIIIDVLNSSIQLKPDLNKLISVNLTGGYNNNSEPSVGVQAAALSWTPLSLESLIREPANDCDDHYGAKAADDKSCSARAAETNPAAKTATSGKQDPSVAGLVTPSSALLYRLELGQLEATKLEIGSKIKQVLEKLKEPSASQEHEQLEAIVANKMVLPERFDGAITNGAFEVSLRFDLQFASDFRKDCDNLHVKYKLRLIDHHGGRVSLIDDNGKRRELKDDTLNDDNYDDDDDDDGDGDGDGDGDDGDGDKQQVAAVADDVNSPTSSKPISDLSGINVGVSGLKLEQMTHWQSCGDKSAERLHVDDEKSQLQTGKPNAKSRGPFGGDYHQQLLVPEDASDDNSAEEDGGGCVGGAGGCDGDTITCDSTILEGSTVSCRPDSRGRFHFACTEQLVFEIDNSLSSRRGFHDRSFLGRRKDRRRFVDAVTGTDDLPLDSNSGGPGDARVDNKWLAQSQPQHQQNRQLQKQPLGARSQTDKSNIERLDDLDLTIENGMESSTTTTTSNRDSIAAAGQKSSPHRSKKQDRRDDLEKRRHCCSLLLLFELYSSTFYRDTLEGYSQLTLPLDCCILDANTRPHQLPPSVANRLKLPVIRVELSSTIDRLRHYLIGELPKSTPPVNGFVTSQQRYMTHTRQSGHIMLDYELIRRFTRGPVVYNRALSPDLDRVTASNTPLGCGVPFVEEYLQHDTNRQQSGSDRGAAILDSVIQTNSDTQKVIEAYGRVKNRLNRLTKNKSFHIV